MAKHHMTLRGKADSSVSNRDTKRTTQPPNANTSTLPSFSTIEPVVRDTSRMPPGYSFVPKGNPYVTRNCRRQTQQSHKVVYAVVNDRKKQVGIRVPGAVHADVLQSEKATRSDRRELVRKNDETIEKSLGKAIRKQFPRLPHEELRMIMRRATAKGQGRVGRTQTITMKEKAHLAVQAHIRHTKTNYDDLLKSGTERESARSMISQRVLDVLKEWGFTPTKGRLRKNHEEKKSDKTASLKEHTTTVDTTTRSSHSKRVGPIAAVPIPLQQQKQEAEILVDSRKPVQTLVGAATGRRKVRKYRSRKIRQRAQRDLLRSGESPS
ncbi:hypothetical protein GGR55DRAFT_657406 [Xylaria sp. FL0064]|nr:hypothetical protein GGR55DRAFT_657406 [Xylaria sp. FL0064]